MKIAPDTNVLLRAMVQDDPRQTRPAQRALSSAQLVAISTHALCELAWVMRSGYKRPKPEIATNIRALVGADNVVCDRAAVDAGLAMLDAGGDFADGVIAHEGRALGGDDFVSFDKGAVALMRRTGVSARALD